MGDLDVATGDPFGTIQAARGDALLCNSFEIQSLLDATKAAITYHGHRSKPLDPLHIFDHLEVFAQRRCTTSVPTCYG